LHAVEISSEVACDIGEVGESAESDML